MGAGSLITGRQIKDGSITGADIGRSSVPLNRLRGVLPAGARGETGPAGPAGRTGAAGPAGVQEPAGPPGVTGLHLVVLDGTLTSGRSTGTFDAFCPAGELVLGGGVATFNPDIVVTTSTPLIVTGAAQPTRWRVEVRTQNGLPVTADSFVIVRIVCAAAA